MTPPEQPTLPTIRDWTEPQTILPGQLADIMAEGTAAGWEAWRMDRHPAGRRLKLQRRGEARRAAMVSHPERSQSPEQP
jgi:hypothetical protein